MTAFVCFAPFVLDVGGILTKRIARQHGGVFLYNLEVFVLLVCLKVRLGHPLLAIVRLPDFTVVRSEQNVARK